MATEFTPGPWVRQDTADYAEIMSGDVKVALVGKPADADLVAAVPDLLAALRIAVEEIEDLRKHANNHGGMVDEERFLEGRAAITKATGQ